MPKYICVNLSDAPQGKELEMREWMVEHMANAVAAPGYLSAQLFSVVPMENPHPEADATYPPYRFLALYEIDEQALRSIATEREGYLDDSRATPHPPGGIGPHRPDAFVFEAASERFVSEPAGTPSTEHHESEPMIFGPPASPR